MKKHNIFYLLLAFSTGLALQTKAYTDHKWRGGVDTDFTNSTNWDYGDVPPYGVTNGNTRISVYNGSNHPLYYTAGQGYTLHTNAEHRGLFIGSGTAGTMYITGGTYESRPKDPNGLSYNADGTLVIDGGNYIQSGANTRFDVKYNGTGTGTLTVSNGLFQAGELFVTPADASSSGIINLDGGTTRVSKILVNSTVGSSIINFNGGILEANRTEEYFLRNFTEANILEGGALIDTKQHEISISQELTGAGGITKSGDGYLNLNGNNTFSGDVLVEDGTLRLNSDTALGSTEGSTTVKNGAVLSLQNNITVTNETLVINGQSGSTGALSTSRHDNTWDGDVVLGQSGTRISAYAGATLRIKGVISDGGNNYDIQFRGSSTGATVLSGENTYGGATYVVVATLKLDGGDNRLPITTELIIGNSSDVEDATFDLNGYNQEVAKLDDLGSVMTNRVIDSAGGGSLTVNDSGNRTFAGDFVGPLTLVKTNSNTLTLNGDMQATSIAVNQGTLQGSATWHCLFNGSDTPNQMIVTNGTLDISSMTFNFDEGTPTTPGTYVIVDYSAGGTLTANPTAPYFADTEDMPEVGSISHNTVTKQILFTYGKAGTLILLN